MKLAPRPPRYLNACLILITLVLSSSASAQVAQGSPAPEFPVVDENGVDLVGGMPQLNRREVSIGSSDSGLGRSYQFWSGDDNNMGSVQSQLPTGATQQYTYVSFGTKSAVFSQSGGLYTDAQSLGNQLTYDSTSGTFTYIDRDGTKATFHTYEPALAFGENPRTLINSIILPNGSTENLQYDEAQQNVKPNLSITNSAGYGLFYVYPASGTSNGFNGISAINLGKQYCAATSTNCVPTSSAAGTEYTYVDAQSHTQTGTSTNNQTTNVDAFSASSALGRTITYRRETDGTFVSDPSSTSYWQTYQTHLDVQHPVEGTETYTFGKYDNSVTGAGDISNRIIQVVKGGLTWTYSWQYTGLQSPWASSVTVQYPSQGYRTLTLGHVTEWATRVIQDSLTLADGSVRTKTYSWDSYGRLIKAMNPEGDYVTYTYDGRGNITSVARTPKPGSTLSPQTTSYGFSATCSNIVVCNKPNYKIDANNNRTDYTYDPVHGGILTETMPADANGIRPQIRYAYNQLSASILSSAGQLVSGPAVWKLTSKSFCRTTASCSGGVDETVTTYTYDANLQLTGETVKTGNGTLLSSTSKTYDPIGNIVQVQGPLGAADITKNTYDADRELVFTAGPDPDGAGPLGVLVSKHAYDADAHEAGVASGYATDQSDAALKAMTITKTLNRNFDSLGRPTLEELFGGSTALEETQYSYGSDGRLECKAIRMNPAGFASPPASACSLGSTGDQITRTTYDAADEVLQIQKGYGTSLQENYATYSYSPNGKRASVTDANGNFATMAYDGFDRLSQWTFPSKTTAGQVNSADYEAYGYDADDNRTSLRKRDGSTIGCTYDALNRTTVKTEPSGPSVYYAYDLQGHQLYARFGSATGSGITNTYDGLGRLLTSTTNQTGASLLVSHQYDAASNLTSVTHPDNQVFTYAYDELSRLTGLYQGTGTGNPLDTFTYNADGTLNARTIGASGGTPTSTYGYDPIGRLTSQSEAFPSYPANNVGWTFTRNPASDIGTEMRDNDSYAYSGLVAVNRPYAVNGLNQYTTAGPASFTYDANGNLTSDGTNSYAYDAENRLVSATAGGVTTTLTYDPLGRLFQVVKGSANTRFLYDGDALINEYDGSGNLVSRYVHGSNPDADDPLVWYVGSTFATVRHFHVDHLGSIVGITNCNASAPCINSYDEYGIPGASNVGRFQYTGQAWIPELGMYYYKARMYSPTLGRFLQTDPVGYEGGINLYEYADDDPTDNTDPSGDCPKLNAGATACLQQKQNEQKKDLQKPLTIEQVRKLVKDNNRSDQSDNQVMAQIYKESRFKYWDKSRQKSSSATGLMMVTRRALIDVNRSSKEKFTHSEMTDPAANIRAGTTYLQLRVNWAHGDVQRGLNGYGTGPGYADNILRANGDLTKNPSADAMAVLRADIGP